MILNSRKHENVREYFFPFKSALSPSRRRHLRARKKSVTRVFAFVDLVARDFASFL